MLGKLHLIIYEQAPIENVYNIYVYKLSENDFQYQAEPNNTQLLNTKKRFFLEKLFLKAESSLSISSHGIQWIPSKSFDSKV